VSLSDAGEFEGFVVPRCAESIPLDCQVHLRRTWVSDTAASAVG